MMDELKNRVNFLGLNEKVYFTSWSSRI
jgi:hypothetical protein